MAGDLGRGERGDHCRADRKALSEVWSHHWSGSSEGNAQEAGDGAQGGEGSVGAPQQAGGAGKSCGAPDGDESERSNGGSPERTRDGVGCPEPEEPCREN